MKYIYGLLLFITASSASAAENLRWVQGSWISIYQTADEQSAVIAHWIVNTQVDFLNETKDWCQAKNSSGQQGFLKCNLLGKEKVTQAKDPMMAFWMQPSLPSWEEAGKFLEKKLSTDDRNAEYETGVSKRYSIPEFDAMKERMKQGFIQTGLSGDVKKLEAAESKNTDNDVDVTEMLNRVKKKIEIKPSFFKSTDDVYFLTEDYFPNILERINFSKTNAKIIEVNPVESYAGRFGYQIDGFWDVGKIIIELSRPIYFHKISSSGLVEVASENKVQTAFHDLECGGTKMYEPLFAKKLVDYPVVNNSIVNFYMKEPLPKKIVTVFTSLRKQFVKCVPGEDCSSTEINLGGSRTNLFLYEIDLDDDGVTDILISNYYSRGGLGGLNSIWKRYINVMGRWYFVDSNYEVDCT